MTKTALITGASSGIGAEYARQLACQGWDLVLVGRRTALLEELSAQCSIQHNIHAWPLTADLAAGSGQQLVVDWIETHPPLDLLINNAGFGFIASFAGSSVIRHIEMLAVHNTALVRLTAAALPFMLKAGAGSIINVSSPSAYLPTAGNSTYSATKAFINIFSESLRAELRGTALTLQVLLPGFTYSDFHKREEWANLDMYASLPAWAWMTSADVVRISLRSLNNRRLYCIPGLHNQLLILLAKTGLISALGNWFKFNVRKRK